MNYFKIFTALFVFTLFSCQSQEKTSIIQLDAKTFDQQINASQKVQLIDVRTPEEFGQEKIAYAQNINWNDADFAQKVASLDKSQPVYLYCKAGGRSHEAAQKLSEMGFTKIYDLDGGIMKWNSAGLGKKSTEKIGMSQEDFNKLLVSDKKVLIDFYAEWCAPCKKMAPYLEKMSKEMADKVTIIKIDADKNKSLLEQMKIDGLPTLLLYENQELKWKHAGFISEEDLTKKL
ncbi:thioredoxin domain-containing protein [Flavobacterium sp.]|uniref:thioredoxin domain-containing protein n=1 Tax=Flavobacterium sp. TaxID=239 RepID=UPI002609175F|nr:thioredoxin domain-containing protein [Flavobacterium sp.]MDD3004439.1 thioredoxin domain-containing protein [Flavobacterium sp.]